VVFVDASALIAIIAGEPEAADFADRLDRGTVRLCSALVIWETVAGLCRGYTFSVPAARAHVERFLTIASIIWVAIGEREFAAAADAYAQYGKGRHPAALNMGDCFAYACARTNRARLLFKGDEFTKTDLETAS